MLFRLSHKSRSVVNGVRIRLSQSILSPSLTSHPLPYTLHARFWQFFFWKKEREEWEITERKKWPRDLPGFEPGTFRLPGECSSDWATSHGPLWMEFESDLVNRQSILSPSLTSHFLPYTLHAWFGNFFLKKEREQWGITERKKWPRDLPGLEPGTFRLPGECSSDWATSHGPLWMEFESDLVNRYFHRR